MLSINLSFTFDCNSNKKNEIILFVIFQIIFINFFMNMLR